jgi:DNA-directed RNA polymerase specialized sigma24 family protein
VSRGCTSVRGVEWQHRFRTSAGAAAPLGGLGDPSTSDPAGRLVEGDLVRQTLQRLPPKRRAALVLREVYGLSCVEIGAALDMSEAAVKMALHRGREQFRALYLREESAP